MGSRLEEFKRGSDYLICIDSDGCAMDTMRNGAWRNGRMRSLRAGTISTSTPEPAASTATRPWG